MSDLTYKEEVKKLYGLKLHEVYVALSGGAVMRVASGWIYFNWDVSTGRYQEGIFVPYAEWKTYYGKPV